MGMVLVRCLVPLRLRDDLRAACFHSSDAALKVDTQIVKTNKKKVFTILFGFGKHLALCKVTWC